MSETAIASFPTPEPQSEAERLMLELERRASVFQSEQTQEPQASLLTFNLGEEWFAVRLEQVKYVTKISEITPVPGTSKHVLGVINYKSAIYPVLDIHEMLSLLPQMPTRSTRLVIIHYGKYNFAVLVDAITEVKEVRERDLDNQVRVSKDFTGYIASELKVENRLLGLLNLDRILFEIVGSSYEGGNTQANKV
jgi:purine-binding chemotaxis protein CheW